MKIVLEYDPVTGQISNKDGGFITSWMGLELHELQESELLTTTPSISDLASS